MREGGPLAAAARKQARRHAGRYLPTLPAQVSLARGLVKSEVAVAAAEVEEVVRLAAAAEAAAAVAVACCSGEEDEEEEECSMIERRGGE